MDPTPTPTPTAAHRPTPNCTHKRHPIRHPPPPPSLYRECLKNHAASLGGHALDGCGEFMPSPYSLTCTACGCHRNFHRLLLHHHHQFNNNCTEDDEEDKEEQVNHNEDHFADSHNERFTSPPPPSAPHMLLELSTGTSTAAAAAPRKRCRSKFSPEQKERMHELSERLGWRLQKRDDGIVEERCREIGVGKGVFKVWMHNNKHNFKSRASPGSGSDNNHNFNIRHHHDVHSADDVPTSA